MRHGVPVLSSVVLAEIALGARKAANGAAAVQSLQAIGGALAPIHDDWTMAARAVSRLEAGSGKSRSFWNDALLAAQCARMGCTLITSNRGGFERLQGEIAVDIVEPFPE